MNFELLEQAKERVPSIPMLVNMCSLRVKQINQGMRPLVKPGADMADLITGAADELDARIVRAVRRDGYLPPPQPTRRAASRPDARGYALVKRGEIDLLLAAVCV